jgi:hypothetical protein
MSSKLPLAFAAAAAFFTAPAMAQTVYRCGDSYVQQPCPGGKALDVDDSRSTNQRTDALDTTKRASQAANAMEKARLEEEAKPAQALMPPEKPPTAMKDDGATVVRAPAVRKKKAPGKAKPAKQDAVKHAKKKKA